MIRVLPEALEEAEADALSEELGEVLGEPLGESVGEADPSASGRTSLAHPAKARAARPIPPRRILRRLGA
jgi:hypothetical protein